jgi:FkbM family methyltransferase
MYKKLNDQAWDELWAKVEPHLANSLHHPEIEEFKLLPSLLDGISSFVGVGASYGPYSWIVNYSLSNTKIIAIEGNPYLCEHMRGEWKKIENSGETNGNSFEVINAPLSNKSEMVIFDVNQEDFFTSSIAGVSEVSAASSTTENVKIKAVTLDELFSADPPDLIKIDIEGAEWRAVDGARLLLKSKKSRFLLEIHPWGDAELHKKPSDVFSLFRKFNYTVVRINHHWLFLPEKPSIANRVLSIHYGFASDSLFLRKVAVTLLGGRGKKG